MKLPTASELPRASVCPGSFALPQARTTSEDAEAGKDRHAVIEAQVVAGELDDLPPAVRRLIPAGALVAAEVAVAYNPTTGTARQMGVGAQRDYTRTDDEMAGTIDLLAVAGDKVVVVDWKGRSSVGAPERNAQVMFYALAAARIYDVTEVTIAVSYIAGGTEDAPTAVRVVDILDLDAFALRLRRIIAAIEEQRSRPMPDVTESRHCQYCPARHACPSRVALARRVLDGDEANAMAIVRPLDDETAARLYHDIKRAKGILHQLEKAVYARAAEAPIPLGDGRYFGRYTKTGNEKLDGDIVFQVVAERMGRDVADLAVTRHATKKALHEAVRDGKAERELLDEVRKRGGASKESKDDVGEYLAALPAGENAA